MAPFDHDHCRCTLMQATPVPALPISWCAWGPSLGAVCLACWGPATSHPAVVVRADGQVAKEGRRLSPTYQGRTAMPPASRGLGRAGGAPKSSSAGGTLPTLRAGAGAGRPNRRGASGRGGGSGVGRGRLALGGLAVVLVVVLATRSWRQSNISPGGICVLSLD